MTAVTAYRLLVALHGAGSVSNEGRAREADGSVGAAKLVGDEFVDLGALELGEVNRLRL